MKEQAETGARSILGEAWIEAVTRHTQALDRQIEAIRYLADVIGLTADKLFTQKHAASPAPALTVHHELPADDTQPLAPPNDAPNGTGKPEPDMEDVRAALNAFARAQGKDAALSLIKTYSPSLKVEDIAPERYGDLLLAAAWAQGGEA